MIALRYARLDHAVSKHLRADSRGYAFAGFSNKYEQQGLRTAKAVVGALVSRECCKQTGLAVTALELMLSPRELINPFEARRILIKLGLSPNAIPAERFHDRHGNIVPGQFIEEAGQAFWQSVSSQFSDRQDRGVYVIGTGSHYDRRYAGRFFAKPLDIKWLVQDHYNDWKPENQSFSNKWRAELELKDHQVASLGAFAALLLLPSWAKIVPGALLLRLLQSQAGLYLGAHIQDEKASELTGEAHRRATFMDDCFPGHSVLDYDFFEGYKDPETRLREIAETWGG
ncbi:MAG: hypothetical protein ABIE84_05475 [bacterium]